MKKATTTLLFALFFGAGLAFLGTGTAHAQSADTDAVITFPVSDQLEDPYNTIHPDGNWGARAVSGPHDLDDDGSTEVLITDYTGGGRIHVIEHQGGEDWQPVYSTPALDSTSTNRNVRHVGGGDVDGDGLGEIIFLGGWGYQDSETYPPGLYFYEYSGTGNDYGSEPSFIYSFDNLETPPDLLRAEVIHVTDVDGDGQQEILFPNNGSSTGDDWFVLSIDGDLGTTFENLIVELRLSSKQVDYDQTYRGGGSPYALEVADLDGDGDMEISMNTWNSFAFTNASATGDNTYEYPEFPNLTPEEAAQQDVYFQATADIGVDDLAFYSGAVTDINLDGDEEVFYPREFSYESQAVSVLNYEAGEDVLFVSPDNVALDVISGDSLDGLTHWGLTAGNVDLDPGDELIGTGWNYFPEQYMNGEPSTFLHVADYVGGPTGDVEDPASYTTYNVDTSHPLDSLAFNIVHRDSAGVESTYREFREFGGSDYDDRMIPSKIAFLGDVDGDAAPEVAVSFRNTFDTLFVYNEVYDEESETFERTVAERQPTPHPVLRIYTLNLDLPIASAPAGSVPSGFKLSANYPNPFSGVTQFSYSLPSPDVVSVKVYDVLGRVVKTLVNERRVAAGTHELSWDGTNASGMKAANGIYFYALEHSSGRITQEMALVK